ncbi:MAG: hypothetical protein ACNYWU_08465 [Desulfobacterales bacterium]
MVKKTVGHFRVLLDHCRRRREPSPEHVLERMVNPLCDDFSRVLLKGTKNDAWQMIEGLGLQLNVKNSKEKVHKQRIFCQKYCSIISGLWSNLE